jgi:outer membrane protein assembly factor BamD
MGSVYLPHRAGTRPQPPDADEGSIAIWPSSGYLSLALHRHASLLLLLAALAPLPACGGSNAESGGALHYSEDAKKAYDKAMEAFSSHDWEEAKALLKEVKRKYGYSRYARLAELRMADCDFESDKLAESIQGYRSFVHDHRTDADVPYARFRIAKALYDQVSDSPLLPPQEERDQAATVDAYKELGTFLREYPASKYRTQAAYMHKVTSGRLVRHELYVARYYLKSDGFEPAVARIQYALRAYDGSGLEPEAMVLLGETYLKMHKPGDARAVFSEVLSQYPASAFGATAQNFLLEMDRQGK